MKVGFYTCTVLTVVSIIALIGSTNLAVFTNGETQHTWTNAAAAYLVFTVAFAIMALAFREAMPKDTE